MSACSNPSPPPTPPLLAGNPPSEPNDIEPFDLFGLSQPFHALPNSFDGPLIPLDNLAEPIPTSSPFLARISTSTQSHTSQANTSQPDLIAFDSFSTPNASYINTHSGLAPSHGTPTQSVSPSVDDLLATSPGSPQPVVHDLHTDVLERPGRKSPTMTLGEGMVVGSSAVELTRSPSPPSLIHVYSREGEATFKPSLFPEEISLPREETPPLRRSSRPRKSRSPLPQTIVNSSPQPLFSTEQSPEPERSLAEQCDEQLNIQRKRKLKPSPTPEDKGEGTSADVLASPRRLPQVARVHRELGSLSPMSTAVLSQLSAIVAIRSASGSTTPLPQQADGGPQPGDVLAPVPRTPPQQTPAFIFPKVGPNDDLASGAQRPRSPLRPFSPSKFGEGSHTPARRVPIAQAVAEGTYSLNKLPAAFSAPRPAVVPGSPVFKRVALDDPLRSPAKRVPINEAVSVPPPSPGKTLSKGKGKVTPHSLSSVRASSLPPRERSTSVEPKPLRKRERGPSAEPASRPPALSRRPPFRKPASSDGILGSAAKPHSALPFPCVPGQQLCVPSIPEGDESALSPTYPAPGVAGGTGSRSIPAATASPAKQGSTLRQPSAGSGSKIPRMGTKPYARSRSATSAEAGDKFPLSTKTSPTFSKKVRERIGSISLNTLAVIRS